MGKQNNRYELFALDRLKASVIINSTQLMRNRSEDGDFHSECLFTMYTSGELCSAQMFRLP